MLKLVALLVLPAVYLAQEQLKYTDCGSHATINSISITPSVKDRYGRYIFVFGHTYKATVQFQATEDFSSSALTNVASGIIDTVSTPFGIDSDPCGDGDVQCPIVTGSSYTYRASVTVPVNASEVTLVAKWQLHDPSQNRDVLCFVFPGIVKSH